MSHLKAKSVTIFPPPVRLPIVEIGIGRRISMTGKVMGTLTKDEVLKAQLAEWGPADIHISRQTWLGPHTTGDGSFGPIDTTPFIGHYAVVLVQEGSRNASGKLWYHRRWEAHAYQLKERLGAIKKGEKVVLTRRLIRFYLDNLKPVGHIVARDYTMADVDAIFSLKRKWPVPMMEFVLE